MVGTCKFEHHTNLCPSWQTEREKDHAGHKFMRDSSTRSYRYQLTNPPQALLKAKMDNIAIVPASMLPLTEIVKEKVNTLPKGGVFLCYAQENTKQRKILERVGETFREQGHVVRKQNLQSSRQNSQSSKQIDRSFLRLGNKPCRLKLSRC